MKFCFKSAGLALPVLFSLGACATVVPETTTYSFDVYQYTLNQQDFNKVQKYLNLLTNRSLNQTVLSDKMYWEFTNKFEVESFFSVYNYTYTRCHIGESSPATQNYKLYSNIGGQCVYQYFDKNTNLTLTATDIKKNKINAAIVMSNSKENDITNLVHYNIEHEFLIFSIKDHESNLLFIVNRNWLDTPWTYYHKTPQSQNKAN